MKKLLLSLIVGGLMSASASAAPISLTVAGFGTGVTTAVSGIFNNATFVTFNITSFNTLYCDGLDAALCGAGYNTGSATVNFTSGPDMSSGVNETFGLGLITYTTDSSAWQVNEFTDGNTGKKYYGIHTTGTYASAGLEDTAGYLDFSFQDVRMGQGNFSASGGTVPEPGSMALLGSGLVGLGVLARRRKNQK